MDQSVIDDLRAKAKEHRDYAEQVDAVAELAAEILGARPTISPVAAPKQRTKAPIKRARGGKKTKNGEDRKRSAPYMRQPRAEIKAEVLKMLQALKPGEWFMPVLAAKQHARINSEKYRYFRSVWQREAEVLVKEGIAEKQMGTIEGKHGKRRGGAALEYRIKAKQ